MKQPSASNAGVFLGSSRQAGHLQHGSGSQFSGQAFTGVLADNGIAISMDGTAHGETTCLSNDSGATSNTRRRARYDSVSQARSPIGLYLNSHNSRRPHSGHGGSTPDQATLPAAIPYGSLTPRQRFHLSTRKQPGPALFHWRDIPTGTLCPCCNSPICIGQQPARS